MKRISPLYIEMSSTLQITIKTDDGNKSKLVKKNNYKRQKNI
jgi:outer membrane lipoprotein SlyB